MNIDSIKSETEKHYKSEGLEVQFREKVNNLKSDIVRDFKKWKDLNPLKNFSDFKNESIEEMKSGMQFLNEILYVGIFLNALDAIVPEQDL
ncbi:hypothetical protein [Chryseobacterium vrystaatense]|uniref:Uncharacterized protein n=1 Tax=Chryseobacterium vrystaatense TaxID=307480 RepID=A0ABR4UP93_9FLAO|nr:hypothetical protein [Chryseobacterium vrystaatense]KFF26890.1 hypothetical protein IW16_06330 [Chryseobacterium vrystaatense]